MNTENQRARSLREIEDEVAEPKAASGCASACSRNSNSKPTAQVGFFPHNQRRLHHARTQTCTCAPSSASLNSASGTVATRPRSAGAADAPAVGTVAHQQLSPGLQDAWRSRSPRPALRTSGRRRRQMERRPTTPRCTRSLNGSAPAPRRRPTTLGRPAQRSRPARTPSELMVLMLDGWQVRQRGPGWGGKKTKNPASNGTN